MRRRQLAIAAALLAFVLLSACGSADVTQNSPTTYSISAEWGSSYGGWENAKLEATAKATQFCQRAGKQVALRDEQHSQSSFPGAPQKVTITFECVPDPSTGGTAVATPVQATNAKRMAAVKKCTEGLKVDFNRYVACMSKQGESP